MTVVDITDEATTSNNDTSINNQEENINENTYLNNSQNEEFGNIDLNNSQNEESNNVDLNNQPTSSIKSTEIDTESKEIENDKIENLIKNNALNKNYETHNLSVDDISDKIETILSARVDNETLIISEKTKTIYLPYKLSELLNYMESYPDVYSSVQDVVKQEFILPFDYFMSHPYKARFSETYNILRNREGKAFIPSVAYSLNIARRYNLNPAVIAACKSQNELESYLHYLDTNNLQKFNFFNIIYEINPFQNKK